MLHKNRTWFLTRVDSPESLASMLVDQVWTVCQGWQIEQYLLLNDATCPDGAQEYGIFLSKESVWQLKSKPSSAKHIYIP